MSEIDEPPPPTTPPEPVAPPVAPPAASVVPLVGARLPADHGLSGLGLIMQLGGTLFTAASAVLGLIMVISMVQLNAHMGSYGRGPDNSITLWVLAIATTGILRSMAHRAAGTRLLYEGNGTPFSGIRRYLVMSLIQTVVWTAFFATKVHAPGTLLALLVVMLAAWPAALALVISLPRFKALDQALPMAEDKGFEGAAILMLIFGLTGLGFSLVLLYTTLQLPSQLLAQLPGIILLLVLVMLVIRSSLHVVAGWRGVSETHMDRAVEAAGRYGDFGMITAFVAGGGMLLLMMAGGAEVTGILAICLVAWLLLAWPLIIRKFFSERQFADLLAGGEAPLHRRAPDLGHATLGWLLLALGVMAMASALPQALLFHGGPHGLSQHGGSGLSDPMSMMIAMMQSASMRSMWWPVGAAALQLWAAIELIRMSDHHRLVGTLYGVVATGVAIYINLPMLEAMKQMGIGGMFTMRGGGGNPLMFATVAIAVIVPVTTLVLVNRKTAPTAQARFRGGEPGPR